VTCKAYKTNNLPGSIDVRLNVHSIRLVPALESEDVFELS